MDMKNLEKIKASFTDEQQNLYNILLGDKEKLKAEWFLCRRMYDSANVVLKAKEIGYEVRAVLKSASTDYWSRRRLALERSLEELGMNADLAAWRKEADAKS